MFLVNSFLSKSNSWGNYNEIFTTTKDKSLNNNSETKKVEFGHVKKLSSRFSVPTIISVIAFLIVYNCAAAIIAYNSHNKELKERAEDF